MVAKPRSQYEGPERRNSTSPGEPADGVFIGLPMWSRVAAVVGIPGVIAFFLVWMGAQNLPNIAAEVTALKLAADKNYELYQRQIAQNEATYRLLQKICSNLAKTDEERNRCFER